MYCTRSEKGRCKKTGNRFENDESCFINEDTNRCKNVPRQKKQRKSKKTEYCTRSEKGRCKKTENILENDESCIINEDTNRCKSVTTKIIKKSKKVFKQVFSKLYNDLTQSEKQQLNKLEMIKIILFFDINREEIKKQTKEYMYTLIYDFFLKNNINYTIELRDLVEDCFLNRVQFSDFVSENVKKECKKGNISNYISFLVNEYCLTGKQDDYKFKHYHIPYIIDKLDYKGDNICDFLQNKKIHIKTEFDTIQEFYEYTKQFVNGKHILLHDLTYKYYENNKKKVIIQDNDKNLFEVVNSEEYEEIK